MIVHLQQPKAMCRNQHLAFLLPFPCRELFFTLEDPAKALLSDESFIS